MNQRGKCTHRREVSQPPTIAQVQEITDPYADCILECDGMTNVLHYYLTQAGIDHAVYQGYVIEDGPAGEGITWHMWVTAQTQEGPAIIDYRAQMWLGEREAVPRGVFLPEHYPTIQYHGDPIEPLVLPAGLIQFMIERPDIEQAQHNRL